MATVSFDEVFKALLKQVEELAKKFLNFYSKQAVKDGKKFLDESKENLKRWTVLLIEKKLTKADFEWLILSQKDLAEMVALKQAGLSLIRIDQFRNSLLNLVVDTVFGLVF
jgi:hypothetical protein